MAIERDAEYRIKNQSGVEVDVPGYVLIERALANEPDTVDGMPIREFVRQNVDLEDSVAQAHEQSAQGYVPLPDPKREAERVARIRELEAQIAVAAASANEDDDNLPNDAGDVLDNRDVDSNLVPDRLEPDNQRVKNINEAAAADEE